MSRMIQLRHVPDAVHRKLKSRAALKGMSLSDYILREMSELVAQPSFEETMARIHSRSAVTLHEPAAATIRKLRDRL